MSQLAILPHLRPTEVTPDYYLWEDPRTGLTVGIRQAVAARLQHDIAVPATVEGGREISGILWGRRQDAADRPVTLVEDCERFEFPRNAADSFRLRTALDKTRSDEQGLLEAVGCFRSDLRGETNLSPEDSFHFRRFFPGENSVFLLIHAPPGGVPGMSVYGCINAGIQPLSPREEVPLGRSQAQSGKPAFLDLRARTGVVAAALVLSAAAFLLWHKGARPRPPALVESTSLGLRMERTRDGLTLRWDRNGEPFRTANRAVLSVRDGGSDQLIDLDVTQAQAGAFSYRPHSGDLNFGLTLYRGQQSIARETLRALIADTPRRELEPRPASAFAKESLVQTDSVDRQRTPEGTAAEPAASAVLPSEEAPRNITSEAPVTTPELNMPPLPEAGGASAVPSAVLVESLKKQQTVPLPPLPKPQVPKPQAMVYAGPEVLRRVAPVISRKEQRTLTTDVEVEVLVTIDVTGKVTKSQLQSAPGSLPRFVADEAVRAARLYLFRPARKNDVNVPSEMTLSFRFRRENP